MKKLWGFMIGFMVLAALCACGSQNGAGSPVLAAPAPAETPEAVNAASVSEDAGDSKGSLTPSQEAEPPQTTAAPVESKEAVPESEAESDTLRTAQELIGEDVAVLYAAIGEPNSSDYAPSCLVDGEDGELYYDEFVVYTQRTASGETVYYVE